ncbi:MAG TPA: GTP-binding protein [Bdellovibrionales bacterium]|nr:GTP-binding protein [Bdellovibrionales bacterium]
MAKTALTIISGYKDSGKSTVVRALRENSRDRRIVFLEDDGEKDLFTEIEEATEHQAADAIVIECLPNLEPFFVAEHLTLGDEETPPPQNARIDTLVTVVSAVSFLDDVQNAEDVATHDLAFDEEDDRMVSELVLEQVEFADVILLSKVDLVSPERARLLLHLLKRLNPRARVFPCERGAIKPEELIQTGLFDLEATDDGAGWLAELSGEFASSKDEFGVMSFTFSERRPLHPIRFNELLTDLSIDGLVRAKGYVWVASRHHEIGLWSLAGKASLLTYGGAWFAATPAREWPKDELERMEIMQDWVAPFGDRRQEIAFIGVNVDEQEIRERLEECLLTSEEMTNGPDSWFSLPDPLPDWHIESDPESYGN